ncbi:ATP-binding protein [Sneathiella sp.]|uniref:ATP-binding protein n=1 Tax=Sneathiella sp. TaxID=1964365 RepID=UPI00262A537E|nr:ATP-binding protein [Sneathiella sp.]MDF2368491.1 ATP-binding protein [Sneathiella sp.]
MTEQFHKHFGVILAFVAALFALLFFWTYQVYSLNAPARWLDADQHFADTTNNNEQVMSLVGFHNMIHNFKDYLLRGEAEDKENFFKHFDDAREELDILRAHFGAEVENEVLAIDATLRDYFVSINRVDQLREEGKSIAEIDSTISLNDAAAFAAFRTILDLYEEEKAEVRTLVLGAMDQDRDNLQSLYTTLFAIGLLLAIAVVMGLRFEYLKRRALQEKSETKSLLESFLDYSTVPFLIAGPDKIIRHCNKAAAQLLETKPANLVGASLAQIIDADLPVSEAKSFESGRIKRIATVIELQSGRKLPVRADFSTNRDGTMRIVALFDQSSELKIRERILFEAEHKLTNDTIDGSLSIRRDIQKFNDLVAEFTDHIGEDKKGFASRALDIAQSLKSHVADFVSLSNPVTEGRLAVNLGRPASQKISETISTTLDKFDKAIQDHQLMFNWVNHVPEGREIDFPAQLQRILNNLVSNAVNYTKPGGAIKITTSLEAEHLMLKIEDTGIGIEEEDIPRIFERGVRMKNAAQMCGGLGIGLSAVQETLRNLGGEITCNSYAGIGSDFVVKIPVAPQPGALGIMTTASAS